MSLKSAALLALLGMFLVTIVMIFGLVNDIMGLSVGVIAMKQAVVSVIYTFASITVTVFFFAFYGSQS
jgi:hypothetical protein